MSGLSVTPSPVVFGKNITASGKTHIGTNINATFAGKLSFSVEKHIGVWVPVPCSEIPGGCEYPDFCTVVR